MGTLRLLLGLSFCFLFSYAHTIDWPVYPDSTLHEIGNSYSQLQYMPEYYPDWYFLHTGIDIMAEPGTAVYAVKSGYVKAILTSAGETHWRVAIGDSATNAECDAYLYAHLEEESIYTSAGLQVGDFVNAGQYIGDVVFFPYPDSANGFHHLHFSKIRAGGVNPWSQYSTWLYWGNPLDDIDELNDADAPVFEPVFDGQMLVFACNGIPSYFEPGAPLSGNIDIICHVYDRFNSPDWKITPYKLEYRLIGPTPMDWKTTFCFTSPLNTYGSEPMEAWYSIYADDDSTFSVASYFAREYYIHITHSDGDSLLELSDNNECWHTADFEDGEYTVEVRATDCAGNSTVISETVTIGNYIPLGGTIHPSDAPPDTAGFLVTLTNAGVTDTTESDGIFDFGTMSAGPEIISVRKDGYWPFDTAFTLISNHYLDITLDPIDFVCGDANGDATVDASDIDMLADYLFAGLSAPVPLESGDADNCGGSNIGDIAFLSDYIYRGGAVPCDTYHDCDIIDASANITIGCPVDILTAGSDAFSIPIYYSNDTAVAAVTIALAYDSDDIQVDSIIYATVLADAFTTYGANILNDSNKVVLYCFGTTDVLAPQSGTQIANIWFSLLPGTSSQTVNILNTTATLGINSECATPEGRIVPLSYNDCGSVDITITVHPIGDANGDGIINIGDAVFLVTYIFKGGSAPSPIESGDANCDGSCNIGDAVFLVQYIFQGGPPPGCN